MLKKQTTIEEVSSNSLVGIGVALASTANPLAAALPTLFSSLAAGRMQKRIDDAIAALEKDHALMKERIMNMSDAQYKLVGEAVLAMVRSTDTEKLDYLRTIAVNGVLDTELAADRAYALTRIIRDVSAVEIHFLLETAPYKGIGVPVTEQQTLEQIESQKNEFRKVDWYIAENDVKTRAVLGGLLSLGLIIKGHYWDEGYQLTPLAFALLAAVKAPNRPT